MEDGGITQTETRKGERDYTDEALTLFNHPKPLMTALDTEFNSLRSLNLNLLRAGQLQRRWLTVSNSLSQDILQ